MSNGNGAIEKLRGVVESRKEAMLRMLPGKVGGGERFAELMLAVISTPEIAACTPPSVVAAAYACARLGLTPDPILGHIYIIPRNVKIRVYNQPDRWEKQANIQIGYKGMIELARRSGIVRSINTEVVYDGDGFRYWSDENGKHIRHEPKIDREEGARPLAVYCVAELAGGGWPQVEVMPWGEVQRIRQKFADEKSKAWISNEVEMGKKTVVRRASKLWPQSPELAQAVQWEEQVERGEAQELPGDPLGDNLPSVIAETPRRRSLIAPTPDNGGANGNGNVRSDDDPPPYTDDDIPAGGETPTSLDAGHQAAPVPTEAPAPAAPAQAPTTHKRPGPKTEAKKQAPAPDGPTDPKDIAEVFVATKTAKELRQYIDTVKAMNAALVAAELKMAGVLNIEHAHDDEIRNAAWNVKFAMEGGRAVAGAGA
jgi:recombination protein RecT